MYRCDRSVSLDVERQHGRHCEHGRGPDPRGEAGSVTITATQTDRPAVKGAMFLRVNP